MIQHGAPIRPAIAMAEHPLGAVASTAGPAPSTGQLVGKTLLAFVCALAASIVVGAVAGILGYWVFAADGDAGDWDMLGSLIVGVLAFLVIGTLVYIAASIAGVIRFLPAGHRTIPALFLVSPIVLGSLFLTGMMGLSIAGV